MRSKLLLVVTAAILTVTLGPGAGAATQKKVTLSQAWKICKEDVDKAVPKSADHATQRYMRAGACMKRLGYQL